MNAIKKVEIRKGVLELFEEITREVFSEQSVEFSKSINVYEVRILELSKKEKEIMGSIDKIINFPTILEMKNKELDDIKSERRKLERKINIEPINLNLESFIKNSKNVLTHLEQLALEVEKPEIISLVFDIVFDGTIEYEKIEKHTHILT